MEGEEPTQNADPDQPEEQEQQLAEEVKPVETRSEWDTDLEPDSRWWELLFSHLFSTSFIPVFFFTISRQRPASPDQDTGLPGGL